ncbi:hypothetical protein D1159_15765 [Pseudoflavonifractor sp. 524-17]|uniref:leucine-rich repeat protein n=1 Tax=Pseudoflavonifractor sp. 524-17 TaxID=2304577 RepID=UPI00137A3248|nr:leucine-rich repeat protein [Pseudoflavonifractor sp. 524-17]NCE65996.1 hypothetical protein [Pseudoflavonifractor sp. 524-17]
MKLTDLQVQALLGQDSAVSIDPNTDPADTDPKKNTLEIENGLTVTSGDTLRLSGDLSSSGVLTVTAAGRVVVDGTFRSSGTLNLTAGAVVQAKTFDSGSTFPQDWTVSSQPDSSGYYTLSRPCSVTFDANGGVFPASGAAQTVLRTDGSGIITSWPEPALPGYSLEGWFDAPVGGTKILPDHVFTAETTIYAHWTSLPFSWSYDGPTKTLTISGGEAIPDYSGTANPPPWNAYMDQIETAVIEDGVTAIGDSAFRGCVSLNSVTIPNSVASIGYSAFSSCAIVTSITIPEGVASIGASAFERCSELTNVDISVGGSSIEHTAFYACAALSTINYAGTQAQWNALTPNAFVPSGVAVTCSDGSIITT